MLLQREFDSPPASTTPKSDADKGSAPFSFGDSPGLNSATLPPGFLLSGHTRVADCASQDDVAASGLTMLFSSSSPCWALTMTHRFRQSTTIKWRNSRGIPNQAADLSRWDHSQHPGDCYRRLHQSRSSALVGYEALLPGGSELELVIS